MMQIILLNIILGALYSGIISFAAFRFKALTFNGVIAAILIGIVVFGVGGWNHTIPLLIFFITSSALSRWRKSRKEILGYAKTGRRDAWQVFANGGVATLCVLLPLFGVDKATAFTAYLASLAAANADTWATEIGSAIGGVPYHIISWKRAATGTSGAISVAGSIAMCVGSGLIALCAHNANTGIVVCASGICGAMLDSLAGATIQGQWIATSNDKSGNKGNNNSIGNCESIRYIEYSKSTTKPDLGFRFCTNEVVNFICTLSAAIIATII